MFQTLKEGSTVDQWCGFHSKRKLENLGTGTVTSRLVVIAKKGNG